MEQITIEQTEEIKKLIDQYKELDNNKGYDRRKKDYKDTEKKQKLIESQIKVIILEQATRQMSKLGYNFLIGVGNTVATYDSDRYSLYLHPGFSTYFRDERFTCNVYLYNSRSTHYRPALIELKKPTEKVIEAIKTEMAKQDEARRVQNANNVMSNVFYRQVKDDVTNKSGDWREETQGDNWVGNKVEQEYYENQERSWNSNRATVEFYQEKAVFDGRIRIETNDLEKV